MRRRIVTSAGVVGITLLSVLALFTMTGLQWSTGNGRADPGPLLQWLANTGLWALLVALPVAGFLLLGVRRALRAAERRETAVDEGGLRWRRGLARGYEPFARIADVTAETHGLGGAVLAITRTDGSVLRLACGDDRELLPSLLRRMREPAPESVSLAPLARAGAPLATWLARLDALAAHDEGGYRDAALGEARLSAIVLGRARDAELRAAAAYVLARRGEGPGRAAVLRALAGDPPPIVIALAAQADGSLVARDDFARAITFLDPEDRPDPLLGPRVRVDVPEPVEEVLLDESEPSEAAPRDARRGL